MISHPIQFENPVTNSFPGKYRSLDRAMVKGIFSTGQRLGQIRIVFDADFITLVIFVAQHNGKNGAQQ